MEDKNTGEPGRIKNPFLEEEEDEHHWGKFLDMFILAFFGPEIQSAYINQDYLAGLEDPKEGEEPLPLTPYEISIFKIGRSLKNFAEKNKRIFPEWRYRFLSRSGDGLLLFFAALVKRHPEAEGKCIHWRRGGIYDVQAVGHGDFNNGPDLLDLIRIHLGF